MGEELSLPETRPVVSWALAAVALVAGAAYLDDLPTPQVGAGTYAGLPDGAMIGTGWPEGA